MEFLVCKHNCISTHIIASVVLDCSDGLGLEFLFDNNLDLFGRGTTLIGGGLAFGAARI